MDQTLFKSQISGSLFCKQNLIVGACGCSYRSEKSSSPSIPPFFFSRLGCFTEVSVCSIESFDRLTALCFLSVSHAQLMRRAESHGRRGSRLQGALREALAKVTAEQVLFVEENFLGKIDDEMWWVMSGDAKWFANIKGFIFLDAHVVAKFEPFTLKEVKFLVFGANFPWEYFDEAISNHRCFDDFVWEGESHECEQFNQVKMTSMWVHVGDWFLFVWEVKTGSSWHFFQGDHSWFHNLGILLTLGSYSEILWISLKLSIAGSLLICTKESLRDSYEAFPKDAKGNLPPHQALPALARAYFAKVSFGGG